MSFRKPEWLDTGIGIIGFLLTLVSTLTLIIDEKYFSPRIAVISALVFGFLIFFVAILFRPKHSFANIENKDLKAISRKLLKNTNELIVVNPSKSRDVVENLLSDAVSKDVVVSVVGDAVLLHDLLSYISEKDERKFFDSARISGNSSNECILCFLKKQRSEIHVLFLSKVYSYQFKLVDKTAVGLVSGILKREAANIKGFIGLEGVANPRKIISVAQDEQKKYLRNFQSLQNGYISFYGTEVQSVQSGWVESGDFNAIDTLDMTTNPQRLLNRHRYNAANQKFINRGGRIRRVYMVQSNDLSNSDYKSHLKKLYTQQIEMGVEIGLLVIDEIPQHYRKDFIIYDDSIVLIEDQQANADYTLGRSTAYFGAQELQQHRNDFDKIWSGKITGFKPNEYATEVLQSF